MTQHVKLARGFGLLFLRRAVSPIGATFFPRATFVKLRAYQDPRGGDLPTPSLSAGARLSLAP